MPCIETTHIIVRFCLFHHIQITFIPFSPVLTATNYVAVHIAKLKTTKKSPRKSPQEYENNLRLSYSTVVHQYQKIERTPNDFLLHDFKVSPSISCNMIYFHLACSHTIREKTNETTRKREIR